MSLTVADINIITKQAVALSSDAAKLNQQLQQLLNTLVPGERIQAILDVQVIRQQEIPVLRIGDVTVPISKEQVAQLPLTTDRPIEFNVQAVNDQQLKLQLVANTRQTVYSDQIPATEEVEKARPDHTRVLNVLRQIHNQYAAETSGEQPVRKPVSQGNQTEHQARSLPPETLTQPLQDKVITGSLTDSNKPNVEVTSRTASDQTNSQPVPGSRAATTRLAAEQTATTGVLQDSTTQRILPEVNQAFTNISGPSTGRHEAQNTATATTQSASQVVNDSPRPGESSKVNAASIEQVSIPLASRSGEAQTERPTSSTTSPVYNTPVVQSEQMVLNKEQVKTPITQVQEPPVRLQESHTQIQVQSAQGDKSIQDYLKPRINIAIEIPNQQQFPILAQSVLTETQRVIQSQSSSLTAQLNKLFAQLDRLNQWHSDNKRHLRSQSGQALNKATSDIRGGIGELKRYLVKSRQAMDQAGVKKAIRHSGSFLEQKQEAARTNQRTTSPSFHQDTKGNLQRLVSATLYHIAKLSTASPGTTTSSSTTSPAQTTTQAGGQGNLVAPNPQTATAKPDLLLKIKERLHAFGDKSIPQELPRQLLQLLRQILTLSNQSLSQTQLQQLANLRPDNLAPQWFFEIPLFQQEQAEPLQLLIKQEQGEHEQQQDKIWTLVLQFDIRQLGKIRAILQWQADHITIRFLSEQQNTAELIESELDYVRQLIKDRQLTLDELEVTQAQLDDLKVTSKEAAHV